MPAVALADRDGLYGAARFADACDAKEGVRPIGASLTVRGRDAPALEARTPAAGRERDPARARRGRVREPVSARHRRAHDGRAAILPHPRTGLRARRGLVALLGAAAAGALAAAGRIDAALGRSSRTGTRSASGRSSPCSTSSRRTRTGRSARSCASPSAPRSGPSPRTPSGTSSPRTRSWPTRSSACARARPDQSHERVPPQRRGVAEGRRARCGRCSPSGRTS